MGRNLLAVESKMRPLLERRLLESYARETFASSALLEIPSLLIAIRDSTRI